MIKANKLKYVFEDVVVVISKITIVRANNSLQFELNDDNESYTESDEQEFTSGSYQIKIWQSLQDKADKKPALELDKPFDFELDDEAMAVYEQTDGTLLQKFVAVCENHFKQFSE